MVKLHGQWGPKLRMLVRRGCMGLPRRSFWFLDVEVDGAWDSSWRRRCFTWLHLDAKSSHMGANVDGVACPLHRPTVCGH
jgi:hypothetical protein